MKDKIFEKMREYGWHLGDNTNDDFNKVYNQHYDFIEKWYDYISDEINIGEKLNMNNVSASEFEDMATFMSDFLRALNDIDMVEKNDIVGCAKISLYNQHDIPYALSCMTIGNTMELQNRIRKCKFNGKNLCDMLNSENRDLIYNNWTISLELDNKIIVKGVDTCGNIVYLDIEKGLI